LAADETVQEYYALATRYLEVALIAKEEGLVEPALFNAIHALELSIKAALGTVTGSDWRTHNVGGEFGRFFQDMVGKERCRRVNIILSKYSLPRYPSESPINRDEAREEIEFIRDFILETVRSIVEG